ncbi:unnamed protein product [Gongylonema pulchrum]|uniref:Anoct_dimer domain-containing protein n=1 Tax=Gongylonema pulchrum TaxID=637853 RepID=A0A183DXN2_9BILA|nr:unnamed protein product [Gongylonema pulchrum]
MGINKKSVGEVEIGSTNPDTMPYIDDDTRVDDIYCPPMSCYGPKCDGTMNGRFTTTYKQGNTVQELSHILVIVPYGELFEKKLKFTFSQAMEQAKMGKTNVLQIRALNDSEEDEVMEKDLPEEEPKKPEIATSDKDGAEETAPEVAPMEEESGADVSATGGEKHDDNPFEYSTEQLRLHGRHIGAYDVQRPRLHTVDGVGLDRSGESISEYYSGYIGPSFLTLAPWPLYTRGHLRRFSPHACFDQRSPRVRLAHFLFSKRAAKLITYDCPSADLLTNFRHITTTVINISAVVPDPNNTLLSRSILPDKFDGREKYAQGYLRPTADTRLVSSNFCFFFWFVYLGLLYFSFGTLPLLEIA